MSGEPPSSEHRESRINQAIASYLELADAGQPPDRGQFLAGHGDIAAELESFLSNHEHIQRRMEPLEQTTVRDNHQNAATPSSKGSNDITITVGESQREAWDSESRQVGDYELIAEIARGGMGVVYKARQRRLNRIVALKMTLAGPLASETDNLRFRTEAEAVANLDHPHIVPVFEVGEHRGHWYFSMKLIEGGSLANKLDQYRSNPRSAAELMVIIARAMHYAHQRGIRHRDLKPSNILLDVHDQPHVTDFGLAERDGDVIELTTSGTIVGSPPYMSPEQATGHKGVVTTATDVYGLGAILYAMLTGHPPFRGENTFETIRQVRECDPVRPSAQNPAIDRDLETICLKCLSKDPHDRYASADALANDLRRWLSGESIMARPAGGIERLVRWSRRHPLVAALILLSLGLQVAATLAALSVARSLETRLVREVTLNNRFAAKNVASTVLLKLEHLSAPIAKAAQDPVLRSLLVQNDVKGIQRYLDQLGKGHRDHPGASSPFETCYLLDTKGTMLANAPVNQKVLGRDYSGRDYFQGALRRGREGDGNPVHISRVFKAENDELFKFAMTAAVYDGSGPENKLLGVIAATMTTNSTLDSFRLNDESRAAVLVGRHDTNQPGRRENKGPIPLSPASEAPDYLILLHPAYRHGSEAIHVAARPETATTGPRTGDEFQLLDTHEEESDDHGIDSNYHDPLGDRSPAFAGRWLAAFAPVGNTELFVIVQQRYDQAVAADEKLALNLLFWVGSAILLGATVLGTAGYATRRSWRPIPSSPKI